MAEYRITFKRSQQISASIQARSMSQAVRLATGKEQQLRTYGASVLAGLSHKTNSWDTTWTLDEVEEILRTPVPPVPSKPSSVPVPQPDPSS